jgi:hypothetical protein
MQVNCITVDCVKLSDVGSPAGSKLKFAVFYQANTAVPQLANRPSPNSALPSGVFRIRCFTSYHLPIKFVRLLSRLVEMRKNLRGSVAREDIYTMARALSRDLSRARR